MNKNSNVSIKPHRALPYFGDICSNFYNRLSLSLGELIPNNKDKTDKMEIIKLSL